MKIILAYPTISNKEKSDKYSLLVDYIFVCSFTPMPGTDIWDEYGKWGEMNCRYSDMSQLKTVFIPHGMTKERLEYYKNTIYSSFYLRPGRILKQVLFILDKQSLKFSIGGLRMLLSDKLCKKNKQ